MVEIDLQNLGTVNKNVVNIGDVSVWFSYSTPVAFRDETGMHVSENVWSRTTGKLLNDLEPDKKMRMKHEEFRKKLDALFEKIAVSRERMSDVI